MPTVLNPEEISFGVSFFSANTASVTDVFEIIAQIHNAKSLLAPPGYLSQSIFSKYYKIFSKYYKTFSKYYKIFTQYLQYISKALQNICAAYNYAESNSCFKDLFCAKQPKCKGRIFDCQFFNADAVSFK